MKLKRLLTLVTVVVFSLTLFAMPTNAAIDASKAVISVEDVTVKAGTDVTVVVKATANLSMFGIKVTYDSTKLFNPVVTYGDDTIGELDSEDLVNADGVLYIERAETSPFVADDKEIAQIKFETCGVEALGVEPSITTDVNVAVLTVEDSEDYPKPYVYNEGGKSYGAVAGLSYECNNGTVTISAGPSVKISGVEETVAVGEKITAEADLSSDDLEVTWTINGEEVEVPEYTAVAADRGKTITFAVTATDGEDEATDEVAVLVVKNDSAPAIEITGSKINAGKTSEIAYTFTDENGFNDATEAIAVEIADTEEGTFAEDADKKYIESYKIDPAKGVVEVTTTSDAKDKFVKITITPANDDDDKDKTEAESVSKVIKVTKQAGSSKPVGGGATLVEKKGDGKTDGTTDGKTDGEDDKTDGEEGKTDGTKTPGPKESIVLTIGDNEASKFGEIVKNDVAPVIREDRTMLPARFVAEALGAKVDWNGDTKTVTVTKDDISIILVIGSDIAIINGKEVKIDSPAFIENDRTYTPIRVVAEALGAKVDWDDAAKSAIITPIAK